MDLDDLPGELIMWILIGSEILVFAAGITAMSAMRLTDPGGFADAQAMLDGRMAALNTVVLVTSGLFVKGMEYAHDLSLGIGIDTHPFFTFYFLLTGFHAAHVIAGVALLALVAIRARPQPVQAGAMFWHMVDLVWVLILPPIYLLM
jgi:nitric oxide reductase NorE protein